MPIKTLSLALFAGAAVLFSGCASTTSDVLAEKPVNQKNYRKSIAAPYLKGKINFDGKLDEEVWKKAGFFDDFVVYKKLTQPKSKTEVRIFHDDEYLYIGMKCFDKRKDVKPIDKNGNIWAGDCIELFLGGMVPETNLTQFCWGSGTARYGANPYWDSKSAIYDDYWTTETRIKHSFLKIDNATISIHLARLGGTSRQYSVWNDVGPDFQNLPKYAELIFGSYDLAAQVKFRHYSDKKLTRSEYEELSSKLTVPPQKKLYGPWLFGASETEMNIGWYNHGRSGAFLEYRKKGDKNFRKVFSWNYLNITDRDKRIHKVQLKNLKKGTTYEYRITNTGSGSNVYPEDGSLYTFTTHGKKDLTMGIFTDVHNEGYALSPLLNNKKLMDSCDILVNVGDMLSNSTGVLSIIYGYLDAQTIFASKKPILNFRGNHEYAGCSPGTFFEVFGTPDFKGYSINRFGDVCIIGLDVWNSNQRAWLKEAVKRPEFTTAKHRILFAHFPIHAPRTYYTNGINNVIDGIFTGKNPVAKIDLLISGHMHRGSFMPANSGVTTTIGKNSRKINSMKVPFAVFVNEGNRGSRDNSMTIVEAKGDSLKVKLIRIDGSVSQEFKIK